MKLKDLKERTFQEWQRYGWYKQVLIQPETFKPEIRRRFGDMRRRDTWERAYCHYRALNAQIGLLDAYTLILETFNYQPDDADYAYRRRIFEEFLTLPDGLELIRLGLEQLFSIDFTPEERQEAYGFFELVSEIGGHNFRGYAIEFDRQQPALAGAS